MVNVGGGWRPGHQLVGAGLERQVGQAGKHTHSPRDPTSSQWPIMDTRGRLWLI